MAAEHRVAGHLGVAADDYDRTIRTFIPNYELMLGTIVHWLADRVPAGGRVVDLGAGTGALSAAILDALPDVRVQLVDVDPNMLEVAGARCAAHEDRVELRHARFEDPFPAATPSSRRSPCTTSVRRTRSASCTGRSLPPSSRTGSSSSATCSRMPTAPSGP